MLEKNLPESILEDELETTLQTNSWKIWKKLKLVEEVDGIEDPAEKVSHILGSIDRKLKEILLPVFVDKVQEMNDLIAELRRDIGRSIEAAKTANARNEQKYIFAQFPNAIIRRLRALLEKKTIALEDLNSIVS